MYTYILELQDNCWYVGITENPTKRFKIHFRNKPQVSWLRCHKPIKTVLVVTGDYEREYTIKMMKIYGWTKVRGGAYTARDLKKPPVCLRKVHPRMLPNFIDFMIAME